MRSKVLRVTAFLLIFVLLFCVVQDVLTPDHNGNENACYTISSFNSLEHNSIEVLFLGASGISLGVSPMKIYEDTGIHAYSLSTSGQPIPLSYQLLKLALKRQAPKVVVLDVGAMFADPGGYATWRYVLDNIPLGIEKINMAEEYIKEPDGDGFWPVIFPLLKFHDRWSELSAADFASNNIEHYYTAGQFIVGRVSSNTLTLDDMDLIARGMEARNTSQVKVVRNGERQEYTIDEPLINPEIPEANVTHLQNMKNLCEENSAELLLVKIPPGHSLCRLKVCGQKSSGR